MGTPEFKVSVTIDKTMQIVLVFLSHLNRNNEYICSLYWT